VQICPKCGNAFDGDQCLECSARKGEVYKTVVLSLAGVLLGMLLTALALALYPPLGWDSQVISHSLDFLVLTFLSVMLRDRLGRFGIFVDAICVLASAAALILPAFFLLNGALDFHPAAQSDALVSAKYVTHGRYAGPVLDLSIAWSQKRTEETFSVSRRTFSVVEPGDSVRVTVHPGAFSMPWYGRGVILNGTATSDSTPDNR
jgi:hypothetical protein